jgi:hypothetical protein
MLLDARYSYRWHMQIKHIRCIAWLIWHSWIKQEQLLSTGWLWLAWAWLAGRATERQEIKYALYRDGESGCSFDFDRGGSERSRHMARSKGIATRLSSPVGRRRCSPQELIRRQSSAHAFERPHACIVRRVVDRVPRAKFLSICGGTFPG